MKTCSGARQYTPWYYPSPPLSVPHQCAGTAMYHTVDIWVPCLLSTVPTGGGNPRGPSPSGGSLPKSLTQTEAPLAPLPHKISPLFSYLLLPSPKASPVIPNLPAPALGSVPLPANRRWRMTTFVPSTWTKELTSVVSHTPIRPYPSVTPSPQQTSSVASSPTRADTLLMSGAPDWAPPVGQKCHTGVTGGGVDPPSPGLLCCPEGVVAQSTPVGLSVRMLSPVISSQGTLTKQGCK